MSLTDRLSRIWPGLLLSAAVAGVAIGAEHLEARLIGGAFIESLVLAILLGTLFHTLFGLAPRLRDGVAFSAKMVLEIAIVLLGASISVGAIASVGLPLVVGIAVVVLLALAGSYGIGRLLGLPPKLATLVACGNSICGNSAIVAAAPVIEAEPDDVAASIAFTAALGVAVVLLLPLLKLAIGMTSLQYGIFAGMTVYAVPQVLAATAPAGLLSTQIGTLVKLVRVLMLGPVMILLGLRGGGTGTGRIAHHRLVPWFILGFLAMMALRSAGVVPDAAVAPINRVSGALTIVAMAALGLTVNIRTVASSGGRVITAGLLSLTALGIVAAVFSLAVAAG